MSRSEKLNETALWKYYSEEVDDEDRRNWLIKVYKYAAEQLKGVIRDFPTFTLHDERHILNVLDAMAGILGDKIELLTVGEAELLILAAALHDVGMTYTYEEKKQWLENEAKCREFLNLYKPEKIGIAGKDEVPSSNLGSSSRKFRKSQDFRNFCYIRAKKVRPVFC